MVSLSLFPLPTRVGDRFYIRSPGRMLRSLQDGIEVCVTVTLLDGLVLARSAFHHSMNYKSVVIFGTATTVQDTDQLEAPEPLPNTWYQGGGQRCARRRQEGTLVLSLPLTEASAKVRIGPPLDDEQTTAASLGWCCSNQLLAAADRRSSFAAWNHLPTYVQNYTRMSGK